MSLAPDAVCSHVELRILLQHFQHYSIVVRQDDGAVLQMTHFAQPVHIAQIPRYWQHAEHMHGEGSFDKDEGQHSGSARASQVER